MFTVGMLLLIPLTLSFFLAFASPGCLTLLWQSHLYSCGV